MIVWLNGTHGVGTTTTAALDTWSGDAAEVVDTTPATEVGRTNAERVRR